jgi:surface antigen
LAGEQPLSRNAPAFDRRQSHIIASARPAAALLIVALVLSGCGMGGFSLEKAEVDPSIVTGSIAADPGKPAPDLAADEATIRDAVSSADVEVLAGTPVPWANAATGSRGAITGLAEYQDGSELCRRFSVSRERYDGVAMYRGKACLVSQGKWKLTDFEAL